MPHEVYENPLTARYASPVMCRLWGDRRKFQTRRRLWVALAEAQAELGLPITSEQIEQLRSKVEDIDFDAAAAYERSLRHDVMAHVHAYGDACPDARAILHLGATSAFVTDNTDLVLAREALTRVQGRLVAVINRLARFAARHRDTATLGLTHLQPAQPTTVGKRACLWIFDLTLDLSEVERRLGQLKARSTKGTTGTQASFLQLFGGDHDKVDELEMRVARKMGFDAAYPVTGQTYSRKVDLMLLDTLAGIGASAHKMATDLRLLASRKEVEEPFEEDQIGSSAMAYKRNPMRSERICGLARYLMVLPSSGSATLANQWMERTLDDSANRRLVIPQAFLAADAILRLAQNVVEGLVVYPAVIARNLAEELPFMVTEQILMAATAAGGDRQTLHERIRRHSRDAAEAVKSRGERNDLIDRLAADPAFAGVDLDEATDPKKLVGRAAEQVDAFLAGTIDPIRRKYENLSETESDVDV